MLKGVILSSNVLVAFAGNVPLATHALRTLPSRPDAADAVLPALASASRAGGADAGGVDFIVAVGARGLWRVTHRGIESRLTSTWIGDAAAFNLYQEAYHGATVGEPLRIPGISPAEPLRVHREELEGTIRLSSAIASLQFGPSTESVGEAFISATYSSDGFRYEPQAYLAADHEQVVSGCGWVPADWGTVAQGGFGYAVFVPTEAGAGLIGLYFQHAGLGLVYHPLVQDEAFVYMGVSHDAFRAAVFHDHNVSIDGPRLPGDTS